MIDIYCMLLQSRRVRQLAVLHHNKIFLWLENCLSTGFSPGAWILPPSKENKKALLVWLLFAKELLKCQEFDFLVKNFKQTTLAKLGALEE